MSTLPARKTSRYTCCQYRQLALPGGGSITARIEVQIRVPHDAVLETTVTHLGITVTRNHPVGDLRQVLRGSGSVNVHPEAIP